MSSHLCKTPAKQNLYTAEILYSSVIQDHALAAPLAARSVPQTVKGCTLPIQPNGNALRTASRTAADSDPKVLYHFTTPELHKSAELLHTLSRNAIDGLRLLVFLRISRAHAQCTYKPRETTRDAQSQTGYRLTTRHSWEYIRG